MTPFEYAYQLNGSYTKEWGIWEMENTILWVGPFFNYTLLDAKRNELIMIDAFVFAPGKKKGLHATIGSHSQNCPHCRPIKPKSFINRRDPFNW